MPRSVGSLHRGDLLVSNFNNVGSPPAGNLQGTGTTIVEIPPGGSTGAPGTASVFAQIDPANLPGPCPGGVGLTTALTVTITLILFLIYVLDHPFTGASKVSSEPLKQVMEIMQKG